MRIWRDTSGGVFTTELMLITSMVVAGVGTGLGHYRNAIHDELSDLARSVQSINQSFVVSGVRSASARSAGSGFLDAADTPINAANCIEVFSE